MQLLEPKTSPKVSYKAIDVVSSYPVYQLRARRLSTSDSELEVWQLPCLATLHLKGPKRIAGLHGRNLALIEPRLLRQFKQVGIDLTRLKDKEIKHFALDEDNALRLGLMFRILAPMRNRERMRECTEGIEEMGKEEAAYWLGMAMHRKNPRRVLTSLRYLLTER
jgi:hypothetical protein